MSHSLWMCPNWIRDEALEWAEMPLDLWNSLCIDHQIAVINEYNADPQVIERNHYGDPMPGEFTR